MFGSDVDALLNVTIADALVENDTNGRFCHVVDDASFAVVDFERHTVKSRQLMSSHQVQYGCCEVKMLRECFFLPFLNSTICDDINNVTDSVNSQVCRKRVSTVILEAAREGILWDFFSFYGPSVDRNMPLLGLTLVPDFRPPV